MAGVLILNIKVMIEEENIILIKKNLLTVSKQFF